MFELRFIHSVPQGSHSNALCPFKTTAQTLLCPPTDTKPCICQCLVLSGALLCKATAALIHFLTGRFTSLHPVQLPSSRLHTCDCRGSLSQLHTPCNSLQRGERRRGRKERTGWNIFQGSRHFLSDQPGAVGLQIKSVPKKKGRQQNTDRSCAFQPPPGKVPSSGKAGNFPWPTYSLSRVFISLRTLLWDL